MRLFFLTILKPLEQHPIFKKRLSIPLFLRIYKKNSPRAHQN
jgi:hypothetical protein